MLGELYWAEQVESQGAPCPFCAALRCVVLCCAVLCCACQTQGLLRLRITQRLGYSGTSIRTGWMVE